MNLLERRVWARFAGATLKVWLVLCWLSLIVEAPRNLFKHGTWPGEDEWLITLARFLDSAELAFAVSAPLGMIIALLELKRSGVLTAFFTAGLGLPKVRSIIAVAASATILIFVLAYEGSSYVSSFINPSMPLIQDKDSEIKVWLSDYDPATNRAENVFLFKNDTLDVSRARALGKPSQRALALEKLEPIYGSLISIDKVILAERRHRLLAPVPLSAFFSEPMDLEEVLIALNRLTAGGLLVIACAYLALIIPTSRQWQMYLIFLLLAAAAGLGIIWCSIRLWVGGIGGYGAEAAWIILWTSGIIGLDRVLKQRGFSC